LESEGLEFALRVAELEFGVALQQFAKDAPDHVEVVLLALVALDALRALEVVEKANQLRAASLGQQLDRTFDARAAGEQTLQQPDQAMQAIARRDGHRCRARVALLELLQRAARGVEVEAGFGLFDLLPEFALLGLFGFDVTADRVDGAQHGSEQTGDVAALERKLPELGR
jgi:hypothetical protein